VNGSQLYLQIAVWSQIVSSIVFIAALVYMWFRFLLPVFMAAQQRNNLQIAEAERHRDEVKSALDVLRREIETAQHDAELIKQRATEHAAHERQVVLNEANEAGERALRDAQRELERALAAGRRQLRGELVENALRLAREEASRRVGPALDARFLDRFAGALEESAANG
jgi:F0F1-type ATP synthase membrane subunit b/b'